MGNRYLTRYWEVWNEPDNFSNPVIRGGFWTGRYQGRRCQTVGAYHAVLGVVDEHFHTQRLVLKRGYGRQELVSVH